MTAPRNRATGRPRPSRAEVRAALLEAAYAEFAEHGFGEATVEAIARRAGLTKGAVYGNFEGKFGLLLGLIDPARMDRTSFFEGLGGSPGDPDAALARIARAVHRQSQDLPPTLVVNEARGLAARTPELAAQLAAVRSAMVDELTPVLAAELDRVGLVPVVPARELLLVMISLANGMALEQVGIEAPVLPVATVERVLRSLVTTR